jgi:hypothetical protein
MFPLKVGERITLQVMNVKCRHGDAYSRSSTSTIFVSSCFVIYRLLGLGKEPVIVVGRLFSLQNFYWKANGMTFGDKER